MQLVLNELSFPGEGDRRTANGRMELFLRVYGLLRKKYPSAITRELLSSVDVRQMELAPDFRVSQWARHPETDREYARTLRNLCEHVQHVVPFRDEILCTMEDNAIDGEKFQTADGEGIQIAAELGYPLISPYGSIQTAYRSDMGRKPDGVQVRYRSKAAESLQTARSISWTRPLYPECRRHYGQGLK